MNSTTGHLHQRLIQRLRLAIAIYPLAIAFTAAAALPSNTSTGLNSHDVVSGITSRHFSVASIREEAPGELHEYGIRRSPDGHVTISAVSVVGLITLAYNVSWWQIHGAPSWASTQRYDIKAIMPQCSDGSSGHCNSYSIEGIEDVLMRTMLQTLLSERFGLRMTQQATPTMVYFLELSRGGIRNLVVRPNVPGYPSGDIGWAQGRGWVIADTSMDQLAQFLSAHVVRRCVVNKTGLTEYYTSTAQTYASLQPNDPEAIMASFRGVVNDIGLKLNRHNGICAKWHIDTVHEPTPN